DHGGLAVGRWGEGVRGCRCSQAIAERRRRLGLELDRSDDTIDAYLQRQAHARFEARVDLQLLVEAGAKARAHAGDGSCGVGDPEVGLRTLADRALDLCARGVGAPREGIGRVQGELATLSR